MSSDNQYTRGVIEQGKLMAKYNDVYFYMFSYDGIAGGVNLTFAGLYCVNKLTGITYRKL